MNDAPAADSVRPPFSAHGKRLGVFVISYNAEKLIQDTLRRIPDDVWREVEVVYVVDDRGIVALDGDQATTILPAL